MPHQLMRSNLLAAWPVYVWYLPDILLLIVVGSHGVLTFGRAALMLWAAKKSQSLVLCTHAVAF